MKCKYCGEELANDSVYCEFCGKKQKRKGYLIWIILFLLVLLIAVGVAGLVFYNYIYEQSSWANTEATVEEMPVEEVVEAEEAVVEEELYSSPSDGVLIYQMDREIHCNGIYYGPHWEYDNRDCSGCFYTELNGINYDHFRLSFDFAIETDEDMNILMFSASHRVLGLEAINGKIMVTTSNGSQAYETYITIRRNSLTHIEMEYNHGKLVINNREMHIFVDNTNEGDCILSTINFGKAISPLHGTISNVKVYSY